MCGITGQFHFRDHAPVDRDLLARMTRTIAHRGPDDDGFYFSGSLGLGFRRLAILDLSPAGHQPMSDETGKTWVAYNGEIYNFRELRRELEAAGHTFRSQCDTEVIVRGYRQWGDAVLNRLNGMFGLAIWDEEKRRLLVARDAMGIKPIYYALENGTLSFGSEIRPVAVALGQRLEVDPLAMSLFLRYRYTPAPHTAYARVKKLAPGEMLVVEDGTATLRRWYDFVPALFPEQPSDEEATETLLALYKKAVERHLISDVPLGLLLSGGIDSGLLLGLMNLYGKDWPTYTVGYGTSFRDDELEDAAGTARHYGAKNTAIRLDRTAFEKALPHIVRVMEEPIASSSIVPMYFVCERARQDVKVALIGQGPDELLGGYKRHLGVAYGAAWRKLPAALRAELVAVVNALPRGESLKRGAYALGVDDRMRRYQHVFSLAPAETIDGLFRPGVLPPGAGDAVFPCWEPYRQAAEGLDELGGLQYLEVRSSLPDELLMYGDKLSMTHSLEGRVPFLDREIVEYVQRLGPRFKVRHGQRKWLHQRVCRRFLPESIIKRKKRGFAVNVVDSWFHDAAAGHMETQLLDESSRLYGFLNPAAVRQLLADHRSKRRDNHKLLFSLVVFDEWLRSGEPASA